MAGQDGVLPLENVHASGLRSVNSLSPSLLRFVNISHRDVNIVWLDYQGRGITYNCLSHKKSFDINTYVSHPWIVRDAKTNDPMMLLHGQSVVKVLWPQGDTNNDIQNNNNQAISRRRRLVFITLPVYSLKDRCFQVMREVGINNEDVKALTIPRSLQSEYVHFLDRVDDC